MSLHPDTWRSHAAVNRIQSGLLLAVMAGIVALLGEVLWGSSLVLGLATMVAMVLFATSVNTGSMVLRMYRARLLSPSEAPELHEAMAELAHRARLPKTPALAYVASPVVNAFATGRRDRAVVAVTDGILRALGPREMMAVLAHEVSHVRNNDLWVMSLADVMSRFARVISFVGQAAFVVSLPLILIGSVHANWLVYLLLILAPNLAGLAQLGLSRTREFHADLNAVALTGDPEGLVSALVKLERSQTSWWERVFLPGRRVPEPSILRTHPTTEERIARLRELTVAPPVQPVPPIQVLS
jgi:heat shock protein HtpX